MMTNSIFENNTEKIFDVYTINNDNKLEEFNLFRNLWRETILLHFIDDSRLLKIKNFGQLPKNIIFREIDEISGCSL